MYTGYLCLTLNCVWQTFKCDKNVLVSKHENKDLYKSTE